MGSNNFQGGFRAAQHLIARGRRKIAYFGQTDGAEMRQRFLGYRAALEEAGLEFDPKLVVNSHYKLESAEAALMGFASQNIEFDGLFAISDIIALGAITGLRRMGRTVPQDVSVVGYDNIQISSYTFPALSTISQDMALAGKLMVSKLIGNISNEQSLSERVATQLIIRGSCGG